MKYTKEELQNTYGEVQSLEHADRIAELCRSNGIELFNNYDEGITHFAINRGEVIFTYGEPAISDHDKKITIPLPPKESSIEWKEGAVCFAFNHQWRVGDKIGDGNGGVRSVDLDVLKSMVEKPDFQLNTIKKGDYIEASELDTEQKYNDAVEVFGLFGFYRYECADFNETHEQVIVVDCDGDFIGDYMSVNCKRKLTFNQLMAIGELKRLEIKRDNAALSSDEETELKSPAMASELNSQSNDYEWPKVGEEAITTSSSLVVILGIDGNTAWVRYKDKPHIYNSLSISNLSKPKTPEDLLIEELQTKLVKNNAVDNWMLAANIISGDIEGLTYKSDIESTAKSVINKNMGFDL